MRIDCNLLKSKRKEMQANDVAHIESNSGDGVTLIITGMDFSFVNFGCWTSALHFIYG